MKLSFGLVFASTLLGSTFVAAGPLNVRHSKDGCGGKTPAGKTMTMGTPKAASSGAAFCTSNSAFFLVFFLTVILFYSYHE
jgi:hypothetical protein